MPDKKEPKKKNPTPYLGLPKRDEKMWTYSENKLLDQLTIEITTAWAKDLEVIKHHHKECKTLIETVKSLSKTLEYHKRDIWDQLDGIEKDFVSFKSHIKNEIDDINCSVKTVRFVYKLEEIHDLLDRVHDSLNKPKIPLWDKFKSFMGCKL